MIQSTSKNIYIACETGLSAPYTELNEFQGELKELSEHDYKRLSKEITETGFAFAPHVWLNPEDKKFYLVDGHQRIRTIKTLVEKEGYEIDMIPVVQVQAKDFKEAKRRVLQGASAYGQVVDHGLLEFMTINEFSMSELEASFRFPEIDLEKFGKEFFEEPSVSDEKETKHILEVQLSSEQEMLEVYNELLSRGLIVRYM